MYGERPLCMVPHCQGTQRVNGEAEQNWASLNRERMEKIAKRKLHKAFLLPLKRALVCLWGQPPLHIFKCPIPQIKLCGTSCTLQKPLLWLCSWKVLHWELWFMFQLQKGFGNSWDMLWRPSGLQRCQSAALPREHVLCSFNSFLIIFSWFPWFCHAA